MKEKVSETLVFEELLGVLKNCFGEDVECTWCDPFYITLSQLQDYAEIDFADVMEEVELRFGLACGCILDSDIFGPVQQSNLHQSVITALTFGCVVRGLCTKLDEVQINPLSIFGKKCNTAGAFYAIEQAASELDSRTRRFGPSTRIRRRYHGRRLERIWNRLQWMTKRRLPSLRRTLHTRATNALFVVAIGGLLSGMILALCGDYFDIVDSRYWSSAGLLCLVIGGVGSWLMHWLDNRLPENIKTFADLARAMAPDTRAAELVVRPG